MRRPEFSLLSPFPSVTLGASPLREETTKHTWGNKQGQIFGSETDLTRFPLDFVPPSQLWRDECDKCDKRRPIGTSSGTLKGAEPPMVLPNNASYPPGPETPGRSRAWDSSTVKRCPGRPGGERVNG